MGGGKEEGVPACLKHYLAQPHHSSAHRAAPFRLGHLCKLFSFSICWERASSSPA